MNTKLLNQGSYGCVFQPGFDCKGNPLNTKRLISKIQNYKKISIRETEIGKKIQNIEHFEEHFAPVLRSCNISLANINDTDINKCQFIQNGNVKQDIYNSNEIMYVGKYSLGDNILNIFQKSPKKTLNTLIRTNYDLLESYRLLLKEGIVHFDVKENNIICETSTGNPIIIDFGLSFDLSELKSNEKDIQIEKYKDIFFIYEPKYEPWCIDVCFLNYMYNNLGDKWTEKKISKEEVDKIINDFCSNNKIIGKILVENPEYKNNQTKYFQSFVNYTWRTLFDALIKNTEKWDNYGLAILYLNLMNNMKLEVVYKDFPILKDYRDYLIELVSSTPDKRDTIEKTMKKFKELFSTNFDRKYLKMVKTPIIEMSMDELTSNTIHRNIKKHKIYELTTEKTVYSRTF